MKSVPNFIALAGSPSARSRASKLPCKLSYETLGPLSYTSTHKSVIIAHRGGNFAPENSMANFREAKRQYVEGIEFDVWLSKDEVPMVMHGGENGELSHYGLANEYVFNWTSQDLRSKIDIGEGEVMPTLREVLELFDDNNTVINIELKGPLCDDIKAGYDYPLATKMVYELIKEFDLTSDICMVSSFVPEIQNNMARFNGGGEFALHRLVNRDNIDMPSLASYLAPDNMDGLNLSACHLTEEIVLQNHFEGKKVGVWIMARDLAENEDLWKHLIDIEVDFIYTDFPVDATNFRDQQVEKASRKESLVSDTSTRDSESAYSSKLDLSYHQ